MNTSTGCIAAAWIAVLTLIVPARGVARAEDIKIHVVTLAYGGQS